MFPSSTDSLDSFVFGLIYLGFRVERTTCPLIDSLSQLLQHTGVPTGLEEWRERNLKPLLIVAGDSTADSLSAGNTPLLTASQLGTLHCRQPLSWEHSTADSLSAGNTPLLTASQLGTLAPSQFQSTGTSGFVQDKVFSGFQVLILGSFHQL